MNGKCLVRVACMMISTVALLLLPGVKVDAGAKDQEVKLVHTEQKKLSEIIAANKGKVVLVDFWALFCPPCMEKFPKIVHIAEEFHDKGLVCISVTFDDKKKHHKVLEFLRKNKATFANYLVLDPEKCQDSWDFVALPTYLIFDRKGKLTNKFTIDPNAKKQFTVEDIHKAVENLLK